MDQDDPLLTEWCHLVFGHPPEECTAEQLALLPHVLVDYWCRTVYGRPPEQCSGDELDSLPDALMNAWCRTVYGRERWRCSGDDVDRLPQAMADYLTLQRMELAEDDLEIQEGIRALLARFEPAGAPEAALDALRAALTASQDGHDATVVTCLGLADSVMRGA